MPPKLEEALANMATSITTFMDQSNQQSTTNASQINDLVQSVDSLKNAVAQQAEQQTRLLELLERNSQRSERTVVRALSRNPAAATSSNVVATEVKPASLRPTKPPTLKTTDMQSGHHDWLSQTEAAIRFWNPHAAGMLTNRNLSFKRGSDEFYVTPADQHLNTALFSMLSSAVSGKARHHLTSYMKQRVADEDTDPVEDSDIEDDQLSTRIPPDEAVSRQEAAKQSSAYFAWQALSQHAEADADNWLSKIDGADCSDMRKVEAHLNRMAEYYDAYQHSVDFSTLQGEQHMLADKLILSLPDFYVKEINATFRGKKRREKTWDATMQVARDILQDYTRLQQRRKTRKQPAPESSSRSGNRTTSNRNPRQTAYEADNAADEDAHAARPTPKKSTKKKYAHDGFCARCGEFGHKAEQCRKDCDKPECGGLFRWPKHAENCPLNPKNQKKPADAHLSADARAAASYENCTLWSDEEAALEEARRADESWGPSPDNSDRVQSTFFNDTRCTTKPAITSSNKNNAPACTTRADQRKTFVHAQTPTAPSNHLRTAPAFRKPADFVRAAMLAMLVTASIIPTATSTHTSSAGFRTQHVLSSKPTTPTVHNPTYKPTSPLAH